VIIPIHWRLGPPDKADLHEPSEEDLALAREIVGLQHVDPARALIAELYGADVARTASEIDAEHAKALNAAWNGAAVTLRSDFEARYARAVAQVYSHQELVDILAFFESTSGKAYLARSPDVQSLAMLDSRDAVRKFVDTVQAAYCGQGPCGGAEEKMFKALRALVETMAQSE
jgi:hypothetical protein